MPHCTRDTKQNFIDQFLPLELQRGQLLICPNRLDESLYHLQDGLLRTYSKLVGITATTHAIFVPGTYLAQNGMYLHRPAGEYTEAVDDSVLMQVSHRQLEAFLNKEPQAIKLLLCILEQRILQETATSTMLHLPNALERYHFAQALLGKYIHQVPRQILASYLSLSRKHLGRLTDPARRSL